MLRLLGLQIYRVPTADTGICTSVGRDRRTIANWRGSPEDISVLVVEGDLLLVEFRCSAVVAIVVGYVDCARVARGVCVDLEIELVVV
jgi:hypothetical protein